MGLVLKRVTKRFGETPVLHNISLELPAGELLVLLGPSGCGKSTLLRIIAGLEEADSGEVYIAGKRVEQLRPRDRNVALVFQNYSLYPHMTVEKNLAFPLKVAGVRKSEIQSRVRRVAAMLDLAERLGDRPGQLSGGQRQRVALGRAIIREPSVFLLDEPLSNLDADLRVRMRQEIVRIQQELGKTMVHVTHDQSEALTMASRIALLINGRIEQVGTPEELYDRPNNLSVAKFLGQPRVNVVDADIQEHRLIPFGIEVPAHVERAAEGSRCSLGLRPEAIQLSGDGEYLGDVISSAYLGDHYVIVIDFQGQSLTVSKVPAPPPRVGNKVRFNIRKEAILFFSRVSGDNLDVVTPAG